MMAFTALLPLVLVLVVGFLLGKRLPTVIHSHLSKCLTPLVWLMLFLIGFEFGEVIFSVQTIGTVLVKALIFAGLTTFCPCLLIALVFKPITVSSKCSNSRWKIALPAMKEAVIALSMVFFGALLFFLLQRLALSLSLPGSYCLLLLLIALVGIDLTQVKIDKSWLSSRILIVPALVIIGSLIAALPAAWLCGEKLQIALGLSSGFGWFTLTSVLVGETLGKAYGTMALMIDLFRELIAIVVIYAIGQRYPQVSIGSAAATSADTTLPMIKATGGMAFIPMAIMSGVIVSLSVPVLVTLFITQ